MPSWIMTAAIHINMDGRMCAIQSCALTVTFHLSLLAQFMSFMLSIWFNWLRAEYLTSIILACNQHHDSLFTFYKSSSQYLWLGRIISVFALCRILLLAHVSEDWFLAYALQVECDFIIKHLNDILNMSIYSPKLIKDMHFSFPVAVVVSYWSFSLNNQLVVADNVHKFAAVQNLEWALVVG